MKRPTPVYEPRPCPKCGGELRDWDCYCTYGCDACSIQSECTVCGRRANAPYAAEVETPELIAWKAWCRQRSVNGQKKAEEKRKIAATQQPTQKNPKPAKPSSAAQRLREVRNKCQSNT